MTDDLALDRERFYQQQREQNLRRDLEVCKKERDVLHARVGSQRRELAALNRVYYLVCWQLGMRGRALSFFVPLLKALGQAGELELRQMVALDGGWISELAGAELQRRQHWHYVGDGLSLTELPIAATDAPTLDQTG